MSEDERHMRELRHDPFAFRTWECVAHGARIVNGQLPNGTTFSWWVREDVDPPALASAASVVTLGVFDGLHQGHRALLGAAAEEARRRGVPCLAVTFDPDPSEVLGRDATGARRLVAGFDRASALLAWGVAGVCVLGFTPSFSSMPPKEFLDSVLGKIVRPVSVHVGENFRFGHRGAGSLATLAQEGAHRGFDVCGHALVCCGGESVSSTRVRGLLASSRLDEANELLGRCHFVRGTVVHGRGEATGFGFPTANVTCDPRDCLPAEGVYACYVTQGSHAWPAAANVGAPPTFSDPRPAFLEASLVGFEGDLYGTEVTVSFVSWLRSSRQFSTLEELERVVLGNIAWVRENLGDERVEVRP